MADYKNIKGFNIQYLDSDPPNPIEGQMWFNSTTQTLKGAEVGGLPAGTWASGGNLNTARRSLAGAGTQTATLAFGGTTPADTGATESYNGTSWTELNDLNTARGQLAGDGTQTSALAFGGGDVVAVTESWNGTSWTELNDLNTARRGLMGAGTNNTLALAFGGVVSTTIQTITESWNGTSWTEVNDLNTATWLAGAAGNETAALKFGGYTPPIFNITANTELWNGTSWTEVNNMNTGRDQLEGNGSSTAALAGGGEAPGVGSTIDRSLGRNKLDRSRRFKRCKNCCRRFWHTNSSISIWWRTWI
jgi:hypothetical protein